MNKLQFFTYNDKSFKTHLEDSSEVAEGVMCDAYSHPETSEQDLGVITIQPGKKTPLQKVLTGEKTVEGYISGIGKLVITHKDGKISVFEVSPQTPKFTHEVRVGELMQWQAASDSELQVFEVCFPPYQDGRFENLVE